SDVPLNQVVQDEADPKLFIGAAVALKGQPAIITGAFAFKLYDTYGFPLDLTELMARERGLAVDVEGFNRLMDKQRQQSQAAQVREVISVSKIETDTPTKFIGYDTLAVQTLVLEIVSFKDKNAVVLDTSVCYAAMGGQVGDTGEILLNFVASD